MKAGLCLVACASERALDRTLLICGAISQLGGSVVLHTYAPGSALRRLFFGLEVVVRRDGDLLHDLLQLESLALSRGAGAIYLDDERIGDSLAAPLRVLSAQVPVSRFGPRLAGGAGGDLPIDPYALVTPDQGMSDDEPGPLADGGCFGLRFLPLHPGTRPLREGRRPSIGADADNLAEVSRVTIACSDGEEGLARSARALEALSAWRPTLQVSCLAEPARSPLARFMLQRAIDSSRHEVLLRPPASSPQLGEALLCDLAIVDDPERAALCAYLGTPVVILSASSGDARAGEALARSGVAIHVPDFGDAKLPPALFEDLLWTVCADTGRRASLARTARRSLDGYGADRIGAALLDLSQAQLR